MKVYKNVSNRMVPLQVGNEVVFLRSGSEFKTDITIKPLPEGIEMKVVRRTKKGGNE